MEHPIPPNTPGFARVAREGELTPETLRQARIAVEQARIRRSPTEANAVPRFGVAVTPLPGDAHAVIIREGTTAAVIFSRPTLEDGVFLLADYALAKDQADHPFAQGRRLLSLLAGGKVLIQTGGRSEVQILDLDPPNRGQTYITVRLLDAVAEQRESRIPGIGAVRFVAPE